jgi:hypothetical protein
MQATISQLLGGHANENMRAALSPILRALGDRLSCQATASAGLVITGASATTTKTGATAFQGVVRGVLVTIAAGVNMPALVGTGTANAFNVFAFYIDAASVVTSAKGLEGTTLGKVVFPVVPEGKTMVGYLIITSTGTFIGGTTALDAAGVTINYVSPVGAFDPTVLL